MTAALRLCRWPAIVALAALPLACEPKPSPETGAAAEPAAKAEPPAREPPSREPPAAPPPACSAGAVKDDGSVETGYGFVPTATFGEYVQAFSEAELASPKMRQVCVCWLKTRAQRAIDFEVVFYAADGDRPAAQPYAAVRGEAEDLPQSVAEAGRFYQVDVSAVTLAPGTSYIGARWDPSAATFLFICADKSEATAATEVFFREDRLPRWTRVADSQDPIFLGHRAIGVRAEAAPASAP